MRHAVMFVLCALALSACGDPTTTPAPSGADVPFGLAEVTWPTDASGLESVFSMLPASLEGLPRSEAGYLTAYYGGKAHPDITIYAVDLGGAACPGLAGSALVRSTLEQRGHVDVDTASPEGAPDGAPAYILGTRKDLAVGGWSLPGVHWVFAVEGHTPAMRDAAIRAVVAAALTQPSASATPAA